MRKMGLKRSWIDGTEPYSLEETVIAMPNPVYCLFLWIKFYWPIGTPLCKCIVYDCFLATWQSWVVLQRPKGLQRPKMFTIKFFTDQVCSHPVLRHLLSARHLLVAMWSWERKSPLPSVPWMVKWGHSTVNILGCSWTWNAWKKFSTVPGTG